MQPYLALAPAFALLLLGSYATYSSARHAWWFVPTMAVMGAVNYLLWAAGSRLASDRQQVYVMGCYWDVLTVLAYSVFPVMFGAVRFTDGQWAGFCLMLLGVWMIRNGEPAPC